MKSHCESPLFSLHVLERPSCISMWSSWLGVVDWFAVDLGTSLQSGLLSACSLSVEDQCKAATIARFADNGIYMNSMDRHSTKALEAIDTDIFARKHIKRANGRKIGIEVGKVENQGV